MKNVQLYYFYDPMCSWCWAYRPAWLRLQDKLPEYVKVHFVLGGLAPETDELMPQETQAFLQQTWQRISDEHGTVFNFDFWNDCSPRRSTYLACRAVLAAQQQGQLQAMLLAIQEAYYLRALNPSDQPVLIQLAAELGLDVPRFTVDLNSGASHKTLDDQIKFSGDCPVSGFPSLVLGLDGEKIPVLVDYKNEQLSLDDIDHLLNTLKV